MLAEQAGAKPCRLLRAAVGPRRRALRRSRLGSYRQHLRCPVDGHTTVAPVTPGCCGDVALARCAVSAGCRATEGVSSLRGSGTGGRGVLGGAPIAAGNSGEVWCGLLPGCHSSSGIRLSPPHRHPSCRTAPAGGTSARSLISNDPGGARRDCFFFMSALAAFPFLAAEGRALLPQQPMPLVSGTTPGATATPRYGALTTPSLFSDAARNSTRGHGTCRRGCRPSKSDPLVG